jgi:phosphoheptose isomerase
MTYDTVFERLLEMGYHKNDILIAMGNSVDESENLIPNPSAHRVLSIPPQDMDRLRVRDATSS